MRRPGISINTSKIPQHKSISCKLRSLVGRRVRVRVRVQRLFAYTVFFPAIAFSVLFVIYYLCERAREGQRLSERESALEMDFVVVVVVLIKSEL